MTSITLSVESTMDLYRQICSPMYFSAMYRLH